MKRLLRALALPMITALTLMGVATAPAAAATAEPGTYTGSGFDACSAPTSARMDSWLASPYRAVGVYIGGKNRACTQPELTAAWVSHQQAKGWHLLPIYLGLQAPCTTSNKKYLIDPDQAAAQGRSEADAAVSAAKALGLPTSSTLYFDMEAYDSNDAACTATVLSFLGAWTTRLHDSGYFSGVYGSLGSTVRDLVDNYRSISRPRPDYLWFARYDGVANTTNSAIPNDYWAPHRRIHQYRGGHDETYGGVKINVDNDAVDVAPLPKPKFNDFNGNGWSDLLGRDKTTGDIWLYPGNGTTVEKRTRIATGWQKLGAITRFGDFNRDGNDDVIARDSSTGCLWLYPGTGTGLAKRIRLGTGWNDLREITAVGDITGDSYPDLVAIGKESGRLYLYPGHGTSVGAGIVIGTGWKAMNQLVGIGNLTGNSHRDLIARDSGSGTLYIYPGKDSGFGTRYSLGTGWSGRRALVGVGDFTRDESPDLMAIDSSSGTLYLYPGHQASKGSLEPRIKLGSGWKNLSPLF